MHHEANNTQRLLGPYAGVNEAQSLSVFFA